jgi:hypothetical protein
MPIVVLHNQGMEKYTLVLGPQTSTGTNRYNRYNTGTVGVNYQNNLISNKHDNNNPKEDNPAHKLNPRIFHDGVKNVTTR